MRQTTLALLLLFALWSISFSSAAIAQEKRATAQAQDAELVAINKKPKNEVESMLEDARKRGETVVHTCLENCDDVPAPNTVEIEGFEKGQSVRLPKPSYPQLARAASISGVVIVQVIVDLDGSVIAANVNTGHPLFHGACLQAARESVFTTSKLNGKPVKVTGVIVYRFSLPARNRTSGHVFPSP